MMFTSHLFNNFTFLKYFSISIFGFSLLLSSCSSSKTRISNKSIVDKFLIAYNIHVPDTTKDDWEVMIMDMEGRFVRNLTQHPDVAWTYTAFQNTLYFISDRDSNYRHYYLYKMNSNGERLKKVGNLRLEDSWMSSRNGGTEMIVSGRIGKETRFQLFIINLENGSFKQITQDTAAYYADPCFSPDGKFIVCAYKKNRRDRNSHPELYLLTEKGHIIRQLTNYPKDNISFKDFGYKAGAPRWHPTKNFISYISKQNGIVSIFEVSPEGHSMGRLTNNPMPEGWHDWSPDGQWLSFNQSDTLEGQFHIMLMNWKTKEIKQLTNTALKTQQAPVFVYPE